MWHLFTVAMITTGTVLIAASAAMVGDVVARALALILAAWGLFFGLYVASIDPRLLVRVPQPLLLLAAAVLAWFGSEL